MSPKAPPPEDSGTGPLARPFLHALTRMQDRAVARPEALTERAISLLTEIFGRGTTATEAAFTHGVLGLMSEHTHYFNGFGLLMPVNHGSAVAVRVAEGAASRCVIEGSEPVLLATADAEPQRAMLARLVERAKPAGTGLEMAIVSSLPEWWWEVRLSSVGVATVRSLQALYALHEDRKSLLRSVRDAIGASLDMPFSIAYPIAVNDARAGSVVLVDTEEEEHLILPGPEPEVLGLGGVHIDINRDEVRAAVASRRALAADALAALQTKAFPELASFRELEHRDLERALSMLPSKLAPITRYLVTENRRVQKLVTAIRRGDWQMVGALMMMSHAAQRDDWQMTSPVADFVVSEVEGMNLEGLHGARSTGRSGTVLLVGQPFVVPNFLDRMQSEVRSRFKIPVETVLL